MQLYRYPKRIRRYPMSELDGDEIPNVYYHWHKWTQSKKKGLKKHIYPSSIYLSLLGKPRRREDPGLSLPSLTRAEDREKGPAGPVSPPGFSLLHKLDAGARYIIEGKADTKRKLCHQVLSQWEVSGSRRSHSRCEISVECL